MHNYLNFDSEIAHCRRPDADLDTLLDYARHYSGRVREAATLALGRHGGAATVSMLLVRLNDWVAAVRAAAMVVLPQALRPELAADWVAALPRLLHLRHCGRGDHAASIERVLSFLSQPDFWPLLRAALQAPASAATLPVARLCRERVLVPPLELAELCLSHGNAAVRREGMLILRAFPPEPTLLAKALRDPWMPVRREALQIFLAAWPDQGVVLAGDFLFDRHASIRELAIAHLAKFEVNVEDWLRAVLARRDEPPFRVRAALASMAKLRGRSAWREIAGHVHSPLPGVGAAALRALCEVLDFEAKPMLLAALAPGAVAAAPTTAGEALWQLQKRRLPLTLAELELITSATGAPRCFATLLALSSCLPAWDQLQFLFRQSRPLADAPASHRVAWRNALRAWDQRLARGGTPPAAEQREALRADCAAALALLPPPEAQPLGFALRQYGIDGN